MTAQLLDKITSVEPRPMQQQLRRREWGTPPLHSKPERCAVADTVAGGGRGEVGADDEDRLASHSSRRGERVIRSRSHVKWGCPNPMVERI